MNGHSPPNLVVFLLSFAIWMAGAVALCVNIYCNARMWFQGTPKATGRVRFLQPFWPWKEGMLTPVGIKYRDRAKTAAIVFVACFVAFLAVIWIDVAVHSRP